MSKQTYRIVDLALFTLIAAIVEAVNTYAFVHFKVTIYSISLSLCLGLIALFRWNAYGLIVAPIAGIVSVVVRTTLNGQSATTGLWLAMSIGNLGIGTSLLYFLHGKKDEVRNSPWKMALYYVTGFLSAEVLRSICQLGSGVNFGTVMLTYFAYDLLNLAFGGLVFFIACRQQNLVVDMNEYLRKLHAPTMQELKEESNYTVEELAEADEVNDAALLDGGTLSDKDLAKMEADRRKFGGRQSKFDKENEQLASSAKRSKTTKEALSK
ncbi:MAG: hypothetical protein PUA93_00280 [Eubacteriales bacterium]|nr:hypothetical protein [Eubacteriales bacterium]